MDVLGSILSSMEVKSTSAKKDEELFSDQQKDHSFKSGVFGKFLSHSELSNRNMGMIEQTSDKPTYKCSDVKAESLQGSSIKKDCKTSISNDVSLSGQKLTYKCPICGKHYFERKAFSRHKHNHKRNKKLKDLGIHPNDKVGCIKLKAINKAIAEAVDTVSSSTVNETSDIAICSSVEVKHSVKPMNSSEGTGNSTSCAGSSGPLNSNFYSELPFASVTPKDASKNKKNPLATKKSFKCSICGREFTKRKTFLNHKINHKQNKTKNKFLTYKHPNKKGKGNRMPQKKKIEQ